MAVKQDYIDACVAAGVGPVEFEGSFFMRSHDDLPSVAQDVYDGKIAEPPSEYWDLLLGQLEAVYCECGAALGSRCEWAGHARDTVLIEWIPPNQRRLANVEVCGMGEYPSNGASRLRVEKTCAALIEEQDPQCTQRMNYVSGAWGEYVSARDPRMWSTVVDPAEPECGIPGETCEWVRADGYYSSYDDRHYAEACTRCAALRHTCREDDTGDCVAHRWVMRYSAPMTGSFRELARDASWVPHQDVLEALDGTYAQRKIARAAVLAWLEARAARDTRPVQAGDAARWYYEYGWHLSCGGGDVQHSDVLSFDEAADPNYTRAALAELVLAHDPDLTLTPDEATALACRAAEIAKAASEIADMLGLAREAWKAGDVRQCLASLAAARRAEAEHGDSPDADRLGCVLLTQRVYDLLVVRGGGEL